MMKTTNMVTESYQQLICRKVELFCLVTLASDGRVINHDIHLTADTLIHGYHVRNERFKLIGSIDAFTVYREGLLC